jgi:hypothetical protein
MYVTERSLSGCEDEITEQQIGIHVFRRPPDYDPGRDNIVRSQARLLRQKLEQYFAEEGRDEPLFLTIPRGAYAPVFEPRTATTGAPAVGQVPLASGLALESNEPRRRRYSIAAVACLVAAAALIGFAARPIPASEQLWRAMTSGTGKTLIVPADSALVLLQSLTDQSVSLADYSSGVYRENLRSPYGVPPELLANIGARQYTSMADLKFAARLLQRLGGRGDRLEVRYSRFVQIDDLKESNAFLIGAKQATPWVELFEDRVNFHFHFDPLSGVAKVTNLAPRKDELPEYRYTPSDRDRKVFATLAFLPNLSGGGHVMIVQGTTMAGTEAAVDFLFQGQALDRALGSGKLTHFEILLESATLANNAQQSRVLSLRRLD